MSGRTKKEKAFYNHALDTITNDGAYVTFRSNCHLDTHNPSLLLGFSIVDDVAYAEVEVERLSSQLVEGNSDLKECDDKVAHYKEQIKLLEEQIVGYRRKIIEEETKRARIEKETKASTQEQIDAYGREGLQAYGSAEVVGEEIKSLESSNLVVEKEMATLKKIYADCTKNL